jgi:hypothetical protein
MHHPALNSSSRCLQQQWLLMQQVYCQAIQIQLVMPWLSGSTATVGR